MSFSGRKYRRTGGSNLDEFFKSASASEHGRKLMTSNAPIWCFTLLDNQRILQHVQAEGYNVSQCYKLGEEHELLRHDGSKVKMIITLEGDNVLKQKFIKPDGQVAYFRREFYERTATMTITMDGTDLRKAHVFYEVVD